MNTLIGDKMLTLSVRNLLLSKNIRVVEDIDENTYTFYWKGKTLTVPTFPPMTTNKINKWIKDEED